MTSIEITQADRDLLAETYGEKNAGLPAYEVRSGNFDHAGAYWPLLNAIAKARIQSRISTLKEALNECRSLVNFWETLNPLNPQAAGAADCRDAIIKLLEEHNNDGR